MFLHIAHLLVLLPIHDLLYSDKKGTFFLLTNGLNLEVCLFFVYIRVFLLLVLLFGLHTGLCLRFYTLRMSLGILYFHLSCPFTKYERLFLYFVYKFL